MRRIRIYLSALLEPPMLALVEVALVAWLLLLYGGHGLHGSSQSGAGRIAAHAIAQTGWSWFLMLAAMMPPMLGGALRHLWVRSLTRRRLPAILLFSLAYTFVWMLAGAVLIAGADRLKALPTRALPAAPAAAVLVALVWQASPWKQVCLNHCHIQPRLAPFGLAADWDSWRFGVVKGFWCVGSCWALMLLPVFSTRPNTW